MDIIHYLQPMIDWLHLHPHWAGFATFLISLTESLAIVGYFVPGSVMMTAVGTLIGAGIIPTWSTIIWAIAGAIAGDGISYRLGYHYKENITKMWPLSRYPQWLEKGNEFFHKHGGKSVFLGRFVGAVRPMVPVIAGMLRMQPLRFFLSNFFSALLWAPAYMIPGILIGAATLELDPKTATEFVLWVMLFLIILGLTFWLIKIIVYKVIDVAHNNLDRLWAFLLRHATFRPLCLALQNPQYPEGHGQLTLALVLLFTILVFGLMCVSIVHHGYITLFNPPVHYFFRSLQSPSLTKLMVILTMIGDKLILLPTSLAIFIALVVKKQKRAAIHWFAAIIICAGVAYIMKAAIFYPRPLDIVQPNTSGSFPSGHVALSVTFFGFFAVLLSHNYQHNIRKVIYGLSTLALALIILSRLYLGAHWFTDVLGGTFIGLCTLFLVTISYRRERFKPLDLKWVYIAGGLTYTLVYTSLFFMMFTKFVIDYQPLWPSRQMKIEQWWQQDNGNPYLWRNRFGKPIHLINIQWADSLDNIEQQLKANGWTTVPKQNIVNTIARFSKDNKAKHLPIVPSSYQGQIPALMMVKHTGVTNILLVFRLWDSRIDFTNTRLPLWMGTVNYQLPRQHKFWKYKEYRLRYFRLPPAIMSMQPEMFSNHWRIIHYSKLMKPKTVLSIEWNAGTLMIKPASQKQAYKKLY